MNILIIGGTRFLGRYITQEAQKRNHKVTLFNRGQENPDLFPEVETIVGDRYTDIQCLGDREWDCVIDTFGFVPWAIAPSIRYLKNRTRHYIFISSQSVYSDFTKINIDEHSPVATLPAEKVAELEREGYGPTYGKHYGAMKFLCEQLLEQEMPQKVLHVRPGLIVGPHDYADRFSYWVNRVSQGGDILAPGHPEQPIQIIDVRDLASWMIHMIESRQTGVYNVTGPQSPLTMGSILEECRRITNSEAVISWVNETFLLEKNIQPWTELPLWLPEKSGLGNDDPPPIGLFRINISRALQQGLSFRPLSETIYDTWQWLKSENKEIFNAGLTAEKEQQLLNEWHSYRK
ncbi:SDR family oxidoreductase [Melghirimyces algeriensis]|uniref:2'-hydroxyisoflavone reductase n=1 Tax=Melghirimyces algeriensis TaxID=910412 RepID=A0A521DRF0_9BACL|nr:SDR family oxidoreductase [Melghirimyces algeriensis]SMO74277.1 2'-hydroxyisoflavone reductase [Melghirimyces algeriensis]